MNFLDLLWIFFIISALQPILKKRLLDSARQRLIAKIERERKSRVILLVHRQETMSLLGFPLMRYIDVNDSEEVLRAIHMTDPEVPLDIVLHTPGGLVLASLQVARALRKHPGKVTVFIPHYAMSGGTLIALAADEIVMSEHAVLGPVDPQLGEYPAASLLELVEHKPIERTDDRTLIMADIARKAVQQVRNALLDLLKGTYDHDKAEALAEVLSMGKWTHDHPISYEEALSLGLRVRSDIPREFMQLMALYPQPVRHQPTVEYIPTPHHRENKKTNV
jgi:ClpP class serine protease